MSGTMKRISPTIAEIDLEALRFNYRQLRRRVPAGVKAMCVVKSNAYGHGAPRVARTLQEEGADLFGVGTVDEGIELREAGIKRPILILLGLVADHLESLVRYQLTPVIYGLETAERLNAFLSRSHARKTRLPIHLKVDTGMTRLGILPQEIGPFCERLKRMPSLDPAGLLTHLADAGEENFTKGQIKVFQRAKAVFEEYFPAPKIYHVANSQAAIDQRTGGNDGEWLARFGIALYGAYPLERDRRLVDLKPVLSWKTRVAAIKHVPAKTPVSYGRTFYTKKESLIGILPVGYADGYLRVLSNRANLLVRGKRIPQVGAICMDMMMIDLTSLPQAKVGDEVVLVGRQGKETIRAEEVASWAGTISYEIFCRIAERIPRVYR
jgi:alanine racemase